VRVYVCVRVTYSLDSMGVCVYVHMFECVCMRVYMLVRA